MRNSRPPGGLPPGYRPIWRALASADASASSRAELARRLGVSTHTIQRILVDASPPDFRREQSRRLAMSWVRTLARLARGLDSDPRTWIEGVGIEWTEEVRAAAEGDGGRRPVRRDVAGDTIARIRSRAESGDPEPVRAAIVPLGPFEAFFRRYVERLVGAVDPAWGVRWVRAPAEEVVRALHPGGDVDLGVGLFETPHLKSRGLEFVSVPGCRPSLAALRVTTATDPEPSPEWNDLLNPVRTADSLFVVRENDPAAGWLVRQWNVPPERVAARRRPTAAALAEELLAEAGRLGRPTILVADEWTVGSAHAALDTRDGFAQEWRAERRLPPPGDEPRYPLGLALPGGDPLLPLLREAGDTELFGTARPATAALYADLLFEIAGSPAAVVVSDPDSHTVVGPRPLPHFEEAGPEFRRDLVRRLLATLAAAAPAEEHAIAWRRAVETARSVTPPEWLPALGQAAESLSGQLHPGLCRSCSCSLHENRGAAEIYCRYCANEDGELRPREEVLGILTHWMHRWQGGLDEAEARRRAERFMSAMPAWANT
ncbi:MAG: hypothetical protein R3B81_14570 [bacterium]